MNDDTLVQRLKDARWKLRNTTVSLFKSLLMVLAMLLIVDLQCSQRKLRTDITTINAALAKAEAETKK